PQVVGVLDRHQMADDAPCPAERLGERGEAGGHAPPPRPGARGGGAPPRVPGGGQAAAAPAGRPAGAAGPGGLATGARVRGGEGRSGLSIHGLTMTSWGPMRARVAPSSHAANASRSSGTVPSATAGHRRTVRSSDAVATLRPSGENAIWLTRSSWPRSTRDR